MADEWSDEDIDEDEEEYVYRRDAPVSVALQLDNLVIRHQNPAQQPTPAAAAQKEDHQGIDIAIRRLTHAFALEVVQLKGIEGVSVKLLTKRGVQVAITARNVSIGEVTINFHAVPGPNFPQDPLECYLTPSRDVTSENLRHLQRLLSEVMVRFPAMGALKAIVEAFKEWLGSASCRAELEDRVQREEEDAAAAKAAAKAELEAKREAEADARWEEKWKQREAAKLPAPWLPLSGADSEQQQHMVSVGGAIPCKILSNLALPTAYSLASACVGNRMFIFGGSTEAGDSNDLIVLHLGTKRIERFEETEKAWPPALVGHAMFALGKAVFVIGGTERAAKFSNDIWELNSDTLEWKRNRADFQRTYMSATVLSDTRALIFGGMTTSGAYVNDLLLFDSVTLGFCTLPNKSPVQPKPRMGHCAVVWQNRLVVYGGRGIMLYPEVWVYDIVKTSWHGPVPTPDVNIAARAYASAVLVGGSMVIYGGEYDDQRALSELLVYEIPTARFHVKKLAHILPDRAHHTAILSSGVMLVCGGGEKSSMQGWATRVHKLYSTAPPSKPPPVMIVLTPPSVFVPPSRLLRDLIALRNGKAAESLCDLRLGPDAKLVHAWLVVAHFPALQPAIAAALAAKTSLMVPCLKQADSYTAFIDYVYTGNPYASCELVGGMDIFAEHKYSREVRQELCAVAGELNVQQLAEITKLMVMPDADHSEMVTKALARACEKPLFTDFTLVTSTKLFPVHKCLLACRSEYFRAMLAAGMAETTKGELKLASSIDAVAAAALQRFFYTDDLDQECAEFVVDLLAFADIAQLVRLQRLAEKLITAAYDLSDLDSVIALTAHAHLHRLNSLFSRCLLIVVQHFTVKAAAQSAAWATLSPELQEKLRTLSDE